MNDDLSSGYIFPILHQNVHKTEVQKYNRKKKVLLKVNDFLSFNISIRNN